MDILSHREELLSKANAQDPKLVSVGGGAKDLEVKVIHSKRGPMVISELIVDCRDAMGANAVNTMAEAIAPDIERIAKGKVFLRIISNLATRRVVRSTAVFDTEMLGGEQVAEGILDAWAFADSDPYRCATHNKGIMNGIDAVLLATLNDWRSAEANAHTYHTLTGNYSLTRYSKTPEGDLLGEIEIPIAVGTVGGSTNTVRKAAIYRKILGVENSREFANVLAAVGLAQNFAAVRALSSEGIQKGHMSLHAKSLAASVGAQNEEIDIISDTMVKTGTISMSKAKELLEDIRKRTNK